MSMSGIAEVAVNAFSFDKLHASNVATYIHPNKESWVDEQA
jgi:hypothetical protein